MKLFSIIQQTLILQFPTGEGEQPKQQVIDFGQHGEDSSIVRLRVGPLLDPGEPVPDSAAAIEMEFDRNGRQRSSRVWPVKYAAWDQRDVDTIEKESAASRPAAAVDPEPEAPAAPVPDSKYFNKRR